MKSLIASIMILGLIGMVVGVAINAAEEASVSATVTAQLVAVSVSDGDVVYGIMGLSTTQTTAINDGDDLDDTQTATNDGNVNVNLGIRSSDATSGGTDWELAALASTDAFTHEFCTSNCDDVTPAWVAFDVDNSTYSTLASGVTLSGSQAFDLKVGTPTASTDSIEHTITVTVQATAS